MPLQFDNANSQTGEMEQKLVLLNQLETFMVSSIVPLHHIFY